MNCKHKSIIRFYENGDKDFYCTAKQKEIIDKDCRNCMLRLPDLPKRI